MIEEKIKNIILTSSKNSITIHLKKLHGFLEYLESSKFKDIHELIFCIQNNILDIPKCELNGCNNNKKFHKDTKYSRGCCTNHSKKVTSIEKYGCDNPAKSKEIKDKIKDTIYNNHGGKHHMQTDKYQKKFSEISKNNSIIRTNKTQKKILEKYGVNHFSQTDEFKQKIKNTMLDRYGIAHNFQNGSKAREKRKTTMIMKYGVEYPLQNEIIKNKAIEKFKGNHIKQKLKGIEDEYKPLFNISEYNGNQSLYQWQCCKCNLEFKYKIEDGKNPICPVCYPKNRSNLEKDLLSYFTHIKKINTNVRRIKNEIGKIVEFDIEFDDKIFIELNGNYWHSENNGKNENYHIEKTLVANKNNRQLIHIFEDEWLYDKDKIISIINAKLGYFVERIYARNCHIKEIDSETKNQFLKTNHLQGVDESTIGAGLFYKDILVSVMTFGESDTYHQWKIYSYCNKLGCQVVGGASKIWSYFKTKYKPMSIITYADRRYSDGSLYIKLGFSEINESKPNYFILGKNKLIRQSIELWQKYDIKDKLIIFNDSLSLWDNLKLNGYDRIWDCGELVYEWVSINN